jgi:hypothetical protein
MDERAEESVPLRAIDCTKRRLSSGVYCVAMEGIPCSSVYLTSLDLDRATGRQRRDRELSASSIQERHSVSLST